MATPSWTVSIPGNFAVNGTNYSYTHLVELGLNHLPVRFDFGEQPSKAGMKCPTLALKPFLCGAHDLGILQSSC